MKRLIARLWKEEAGASGVEYGILVAAVAAVIVVVAFNVGEKTKGGFDTVDANMPAAPAP